MAKKLLKTSVKYNHLDYYLYGYPGFYIERNNVSSDKEPDCIYTMEAIYDYYRNVDKSISEQAYNLLLKDVTSQFSADIHIFVLDEINYHLHQENIGKTPFMWDCMTLISLLEKNINAHREIYNKKCLNGMPFPEYFDAIKMKYS